MAARKSATALEETAGPGASASGAAASAAPKERAGRSTKGKGARPTAEEKAAAKEAKAARWRARAEVLTVREDESPWTGEELKAVRKELKSEVARLEGELDVAAAEILELIRNPGEGAGDDQADAGAQSAERQQELILAHNSNEVMVQCLHALERMSNGTYGVCEACENPIGKLRLQAFPRATLCVTCKQKQERR